jgi:O-antigen/teichoic acid export membrane protein
LFSAADRFLRIGVLADSSLLASSLPILSSITDPSQHTHITRQTLVVLCVLSILCAIALYITAPVVVSLTFRFDESVPLLRILSVSLPAVLAHSVLRTSLFARRQERAVALLFGLACTVNIVLNIATIPQFGATGAAVVSAITEYMILGMYGVLYMRKAVTGMPAREHESMAQPEVV